MAAKSKEIVDINTLLTSLQNSQEMKIEENHVVGEYGIMRGLLIKFNKHDREEAFYWKSKAVDVEKQLELFRCAKLATLRGEINNVMMRLQSQRFGLLERKEIDENHNTFGETMQNCSQHKSIISHKDSFCGSMSDDLLEKKQNKDHPDFVAETFFKKHSSIESWSHQPELYQSQVKQSAYLNTGSSSFDVEKAFVKKSFTSVNSNSDVQTNDYDLISDDVPELASEVVAQMQSLHHLQEKQKKLDAWYRDVQQQLELEKLKLTEKYDELRLINIKEQQHIIESSQEFLRTSNVNLTTPTSKQHTPGMILSETLIKTNKNSKTVLQQEMHLLNISGAEETSAKSIVTIVDKPFVAKNLSLEYKDVVVSPILSPTTCQEGNKNTARRHEHLLISDAVDTSAQQSLVEKGLIVPTSLLDNIKKPLLENDEVFFSGGKNKDVIAKMVSGENFTELKLRRKSRPIKFFNTPVSDEKEAINVRRYTSQEKNESTDDLIGKFTTTSTPHEVTVEKQLVHDFSPVRRESEITQNRSSSTLGKKFKETMNVEYGIVQKEKELHAGCIVVAAAQGFLTRCLLKTNKVQEIIKTIKDTKSFLDDIDKENKKIVSNSDRQLRIRLLDELSTKRIKLYDVFFNMKPTERMRLLATSRLQQKEKKLRMSNNQKSAAKDEKVHNKKLSVASQRSLKRRQDHQSYDSKSISENRPKTAPVRIKKIDKEQKPLRPIQCSSSPVLSERKRIKPFSENALSTPNDASKKSAVKKINSNSISQRVMAAKLSSRFSSVM